MTLDRVLSRYGLSSRAAARQAVLAGRLKVNGRVVSNPDQWVRPDQDVIHLDGWRLRQARKIYLLKAFRSAPIGNSANRRFLPSSEWVAPPCPPPGGADLHSTFRQPYPAALPRPGPGSLFQCKAASHGPAARPMTHENARVVPAVGIGIAVAIAIGRHFDIDSDSEPDTDSDPEIPSEHSIFGADVGNLDLRRSKSKTRTKTRSRWGL